MQRIPYSIRQNKFESGKIPLPFHIYSTGLQILQKGQKESTMGSLNRFVEVLWSISGLGEVRLFDRKFELGRNDVFFYLPGEDHFRIARSDSWKLRWLCFDGPLAVALLNSYGYERQQKAAVEYPAELFAEVEKSIDNPTLYQTRRSCGLILEILACAGSGGDENSLMEKSAVRAVEQIRKNYADPQLNVDTLCDRLNIPRSTLTRLFRREFGCTPGRYLLNCRLEEAQALLLCTDLPIKEVAARCGFNSARTFTRFIRRTFDQSPLEVRRKPESGEK